MAWVEQIDDDFTFAMPILTSRAVEKKCPTPITLEALGLLTNLLGYSGKWELKKEELYKRFAFAGKRAVTTAWNNLMTANYIIEFKHRVGKKWEYHYYYKKTPFTEEKKAQILAAAEKEHGEIWGLRFELPKVNSSKGVGNQRSNRTKEELINKDKDIDDDIGEPRLSEEQELLITHLRAELKEEMNDRSFNAVVRKVVDKHKQGKVSSFRDYLVTALSNKIVDLEFRRLKEKAKEDVRQSKQQRWKKALEEVKTTEPIPFYNWLDQ